MSTLSKVELLRIFESELAKFLDQIIEVIPATQMEQKKDLIFTRVLLTTQVPVEMSMQIFSDRILPYEDYIRAKDEKLFLESTDLFEGISTECLSGFKDLWLSGYLLPEDKETLWKWLMFFLKMAKRYELIKSN